MLTVLIKPVSGSCNLACSYCFYRDEIDKRETGSAGIMSPDMLELLVKRALSEASVQCTFGFQGGEPLLAGLPFYERLIALQKHYNKKNLKIQNTIQTNGTLIDDAWAAFFSDNHFLVGVSLDGNRETHDRNRVALNGAGSYVRVMEGIRKLEAYHVEYNILCVLTALTARHIQSTYQFFKKSGFRYLQFIPCLDPLGEVPGHRPYSMTPEQYGEALDTLFQLWYRDIMAGTPISIRYFDNLLLMALGHRPESCDMSGSCESYFLVEADGSVYPCDFYVLDEWKIGQLSEDSFAAMQKSAAAARFREAGQQIRQPCRSCRYYYFCRGGCRRNWESDQMNGVPGNYFCKAYQLFFERNTSKIKALAAFLRGQGHSGVSGVSLPS